MKLDEFIDAPIIDWVKYYFSYRFSSEVNVSVLNNLWYIYIVNHEITLTFPIKDDILYSPGNWPVIFRSPIHEKNLAAKINEKDLVIINSSVVADYLLLADKQCLQFNFDFVGMVFWIVNRLEEVGSRCLDVHERYDLQTCHAHVHGYYNRPIIDELFIYVFDVLQREAGISIQAPTCPRIVMSCDVDRVELNLSLTGILRKCLGSLRLGRKKFLDEVRRIVSVLSGEIKNDKFINGIFQISRISEEFRIPLYIFFMSGAGRTRFDSSFYFKKRQLRLVLEGLRRYEQTTVGYHPSYAAAESKYEFLKDFTAFKKLIGARYFSPVVRFHYLRERCGEIDLGDFGFNEDHSLGFAARAGFRAGTCFPFRKFDYVAKKVEKVTYFPLIFMDTNYDHVFPDGLYMQSLLLDNLRYFTRKCRSVGGCFTMLWHNDTVSDERVLSILSESFRK